MSVCGNITSDVMIGTWRGHAGLTTTKGGHVRTIVHVYLQAGISWYLLQRRPILSGQQLRTPQACALYQICKRCRPEECRTSSTIGFDQGVWLQTPLIN